MSYYDSLINLFSKSKLTGANSIMDSVIDERLSREGTFTYPYYMNIMLTYNCNAHCLFCSSSAGAGYKYDQSSSDITCQILEKSSDTVHPIILALCGGEPMLYPQECQKYMNLYKKDTSYFLLTNLNYKLSPAHHEVLRVMDQHPLSMIQTSIDSMDEETTRFLRQGSNPDLILNNIREIKAAYPRIRMKVNITVSEYNYSQIHEILKFCSNNPVDCIHCNYVLPFGRAKRDVSLKSLFSVLKGLQSLADFADQEEAKKFKELTVSVPNEVMIIRHLFQHNLKPDDLTDLLTDGFNSRHYICHINPQNKTCYSGWDFSPSFSLEDEGFLPAFTKSANTPITAKSGLCEHCYYRTICTSNACYLPECLLLKFKADMEELFSSSFRYSARENARNKVTEMFSANDYCAVAALIVTNTCNGRCIFCQSGGSRSDNGESLDIEQFGRFIEGKNIHLSITGGEPLMRKDRVKQVIEMVKRNRNSVIILLTNVSLIDDDFISHIKKHFGYYDVVQVSVYSYDPDKHRMISGRDDWSRVSENIKKLVAAGIPVRVNLPLCKENVCDLEETYNYYKDLGVEHVCVSCLLDKGFAKGTADEEYILTFVDEAARFCRKGYTDYNISIPVEALRAYHNCQIILGKEISSEATATDSIHQDLTLYMDHKGDLSYSDTMEKIGNISDHSLKDIPGKAITLHSDNCAECLSFPYCGGMVKYDNGKPVPFCDC